MLWAPKLEDPLLVRTQFRYAEGPDYLKNQERKSEIMGTVNSDG